MRIGLLTTSYPRHRHDFAGGFVAELAAWLADQGEVVQVVAPSPAVSVHPHVRLTPIPTGRRPHLLYGAGAPDNLGDVRAWLEVPALVGRMARICHRQSRGWDGLISHWLVPSGAVAALAGRGLPHLAVAHSSDVHLLGRLPGASAILSALARCHLPPARRRTALVITSASLRPTLRRLARERAARALVEQAEVIPMGTQVASPAAPTLGTQVAPPTAQARAALRQRHGIAADEVVVLFIGRLVPVKGVDRLLRACADLEVTTVIVGDGPERGRLEALARRLGGRTRFVGERVGPDKTAWLAAADLLALPSVVLPDGRTDSAPVTVLEAQATGVPVVASRVGGLPELVDDRRTGLLVPPDDPAALGQAIAHLASDHTRRARLAAAGPEWCTRFSWAVIGDRLRTLLQAL